MFTTLRQTTLTAILAMLALASTIGFGTQLVGAQATPAATPAALPSAEEAIAALTGADGLLRFDVAEDATRFVFLDAPVHDDGMPAYGNPFVTQGYIYPEGTLSGTNGVLPDGSPEFPDKVLGEWTCRGWMIGDGAHTTAGPMVITTQVYNFGGELGAATLVSDGYELADIGTPIKRAIAGGTGPYATARGEASQTLLGFTEQLGVNLRFEIAVQAS